MAQLLAQMMGGHGYARIRSGNPSSDLVLGGHLKIVQPGQWVARVCAG